MKEFKSMSKVSPTDGTPILLIVLVFLGAVNIENVIGTAASTSTEIVSDNTEAENDNIRAKRGICVSGEKCFPEFNVGCFPCKYGFGADSPETIAMQFYLYTNYKAEQTFTYADYNTSIPKLTFQSQNRDTWVIIHGFEGQWPLEWLDIMRRKLVIKGNNVLIARWTEGTHYPAGYHQAAVNGLVVAKMTAQIVKDFEKHHGNSLNQVNLIGFSLGAPMAGHTGAALGGKVKQVVGLDPPEKGYEGQPIEYRLDPSDAQLVQVIHTHGDSLLRGGLGTTIPMGDIDIYVNGGLRQPGCPVTERKNFDITRFYDIIKIVGCNHIRSTALFSDSIDNPCQLKLYQCESKRLWDRGHCFTCPKNKSNNNKDTRRSGQGCLTLGYGLDTKTKLRGKFYTNTLIDQGINEAEKAYCGTQYRLTLFPDREVKGNIDVKIRTNKGATERTYFQGRDNTVRPRGRSHIVVGPYMESPVKLRIDYDRRNFLVTKGVEIWNLTRAVLLRDDGQAYEFNGSIKVEDDYITKVDLIPVEMDVVKFMQQTSSLAPGTFSSVQSSWYTSLSVVILTFLTGFMLEIF